MPRVCWKSCKSCTSDNVSLDASMELSKTCTKHELPTLEFRIKTVDLTFQVSNNRNVRLIGTFWKEYATASLIETHS